MAYVIGRAQEEINEERHARQTRAGHAHCEYGKNCHRSLSQKTFSSNHFILLCVSDKS